MNKKTEFHKLPSVDALLNDPALHQGLERYGRPLITYAIRKILERLRSEKTTELETSSIVKRVLAMAKKLTSPSLRPVINATGIILHTNLGRAPLGKDVIAEISEVIQGYSNLEFNLKNGKRGDRNSHVADQITYLTGAESAVVVNNNAAAIVLVLNTFAKDREVIVSRGELIEIGGQFRIPDIMEASGVKMVEVGTTNRTRLQDYEQAVGERTGLLFKAHPSNYSIEGFTEGVSVKELSKLARRKGLPLVYDIGSGLLHQIDLRFMTREPDVASAYTAGADLVTFSGDKLLGGSQAGIIVGREKYISPLKKAPLMRALRPGKLNLAALGVVFQAYLEDKKLFRSLPVFQFLNRDTQKLKQLAEKLKTLLEKNNISAEMVASTGYCGGGSLPQEALESFAVRLNYPTQPKIGDRVFAELLRRPMPVVGILREGALHFDVLAMFEHEIENAAEQIALAMNKELTK